MPLFSDFFLFFAHDIFALVDFDELHFFCHALVGGVHVEVGLELVHRDGFAVALRDDVVEGEDQVEGFLLDGFFFEFFTCQMNLIGLPWLHCQVTTWCNCFTISKSSMMFEFLVVISTKYNFSMGK